MRNGKGVGKVNLTCYKCGGHIAITPSQGGRGTGDMTLYRAACYGKGKYERDGCGMFQDYLGADGTMRSAKAHYHRVAVAMAMTRNEERNSE